MAFAGTVGRNVALRRILGGFVLYSMVEWAAWLALVVYAFAQGGAVAAGAIGFAAGVPAVIIAPTASIIGDRWPRARALFAAYLLQGFVGLAAAVASVGGSVVGTYALGIAVMALVAVGRPLVASLLPEVARTPDELTAANVASGLAEGGGALLGPLAAGALLGLGGPQAVLAACGGAMLVAALALLPQARAARPLPARSTTRRPGLRAAGGELAHEISAGAVAVAADRRLTAVFALLAAILGALGALSVFVVIIAIDTLGLDDDAAGYLTAAGGLGALVGSAASASLVGRERIGGPLLASTVLFGLAIALLATTSEPLGVGLILVATGVGWSFAYVAATTLTQRLAGDDVMTRVFGASEAVQTAAESLGGLAVPILVLSLGPSGALIAIGVGVGIATIVATPALLRADRVPPGLLRDLRLLRGVPMFAPLSGPVLERLAAGASRQTVTPGTRIVAAGEVGDRFYVVAAGSATVDVGGRAAPELGPGDGFGEIALLRDVPRTATVRALEPTELLVVEREPFLEALTAQARSRFIASDLAARRLAADEASAG